MSTETENVAIPSEESGKQRRKSLGRGLGALMGEIRREEPLVSVTPLATTNTVQMPTQALANNAAGALNMLPIAEITPHPEQPRRHFDEAALEELAASIASRGVLQPVIVRPLGGGTGGYQLVAGERRWRAAQRAQLHEIPALIRDLTDREVMALALIENLQRQDLNPIEEARAYNRLTEQEGLTQAEIARMVDKSRSHIANLQRLLALPDAVIVMVEAGQLSMGHARALIGVDNAEVIAQAAIAKHLSVREVERLARKVSGPKKTSHAFAKSEHKSADAADIAAVQGHLEEFLGLAVRINTDADPRSGTVTIRYKTLDQLDLICQRLTGGDI